MVFSSNISLDAQDNNTSKEKEKNYAIFSNKNKLVYTGHQVIHPITRTEALDVSRLNNDVWKWCVEVMCFVYFETATIAVS